MVDALADRLLVSTHELCELHDTGPGHPERPSRIPAVLRGIEKAAVVEQVTLVEAPLPNDEHIIHVHTDRGLTRLDHLSATGGGSIDPDTVASPHSAQAARRAAGAGLDLVDRLDRGEGDLGWSVMRPPGHHATKLDQMGFCLINNVAVTATALADRGERVAILDIDAHHGNGTQDIFYSDPRVLFISLHEFPAYPYTGAASEVGDGAGRFTNVNVPLPSGATGDVYQAAVDRIVAPRLEAFAPTWVLVSLGFDAHRADPLTDLGLTSGDYADLVYAILSLCANTQRLMFLEGGYDLQALVDSSAAVVAAVMGAEHAIRPEPSSAGGPGMDTVDLVHEIHEEQRLR